MAPRIKEMSKKESYDKVKELLKKQETLSRSKLIPGSIVFTSYDAKDKTQTYDRTPLIFVLGVSRGYVLGINFHWLPLAHRLYLIKHIKDKNKTNIRLGRPMEFSYKELKPMLRRFGYAPCIRLYINHRLAKRGTIIPIDQLDEVARLKAETFTQGKYSAAELYRMARNRKKAEVSREKMTRQNRIKRRKQRR